MKHVKEVIVVEGRYDKNTILQIVDATVIETSGFGVFSDNEKIILLRRLAEKCGLILMLDSDKAGFFIRGRLCGLLNDPNIKHAYVPDVDGRERRKTVSSKEGKLGVEGMAPDIIISALERAGATFDEESSVVITGARITKADMFSAGFSGCEGSRQKRTELLQLLGLPKRLSANGLLDVLNALYSRDDFFRFLYTTYGII